jgi:hypothetical protein
LQKEKTALAEDLMNGFKNNDVHGRFKRRHYRIVNHC